MNDKGWTGSEKDKEIYDKKGNISKPWLNEWLNVGVEFDHMDFFGMNQTYLTYPRESR